MIFKPFGANEADLGYVLSNPTAVMLQGDPAIFRLLSNKLHFAQNVFSGVISFSEKAEDNENQPVKAGFLKRSQLLTIVDSLRRIVAIHGDRFRIYWLFVRHTSNDRVEIHCLGIQADLATGKAATIYLHRRDSERFLAWQRFINSRFNLSDPEEPAARLRAMPDPRSHGYEFKKKIFVLVQKHFATALKATRKDVVNFLRGHNYEVLTHYSHGKKRKFLAVKDGTKTVVLRGVYFERDFSMARLLRRKIVPIKKLNRRLERIVFRFRRGMGGRYDNRVIAKESLSATPPRRLFHEASKILRASQSFSFTYKKKQYSLPVPQPAFDRIDNPTSLVKYIRHLVHESKESPSISSTENPLPLNTADVVVKHTTSETDQADPADSATADANFASGAWEPINSNSSSQGTDNSKQKTQKKKLHPREFQQKGNDEAEMT